LIQKLKGQHKTEPAIKLMDKVDNASNSNNSQQSKQRQWNCTAITLDPKGSRYKAFLKNNKHLTIKTFQGVKGLDLTKQEIIRRGIATKELVNSPFLKFGLIGNAASHRAVWEKSSKENKCHLVLEDDCLTHPGIADFIDKNFTKLMNLDICQFGLNTDSILQSISPAGLNCLTLFNPKHPSQEWIENALTQTHTKDVILHRLIKAFGTCAYFVSPSGARNLCEKIFPLSLETTEIPLISERMPATSMDRAGCREYSKLRAFICQPFLAYTPNTDSSTKE